MRICRHVTTNHVMLTCLTFCTCDIVGSMNVGHSVTIPQPAVVRENLVLPDFTASGWWSLLGNDCLRITQTYRLVSDQPGNHVSPGKNLFRLAMTFFRLLWSLSYCCVCSLNGNDKLSMSLASIYRQQFLKIAHNLSSLLGGLWCSAFFATNFMQPTTSRNHYTFSLATGDCTMSTMVGNKSSVRMYWIRVVDFFLSEPSDF